MNGLLRKLENKGVTTTCYGDDILIIAKGKFPETLSDFVAALKILSIGAVKSELVLFTRRYKVPTF